MFAAANVVAYPAQDAVVHRWSYGSGQNATSEEPIDTGDRQRPEELALRVGVVIEDSAGYNWRRERDSNPRYPSGYSGFQDRLFQPLTHPSA
jgi:hypothetical protein